MSEAYEPVPPSSPVLLADPCPKCGAPVALRHWEHRFYTKCQGDGCFFGYDADDQGRAVEPCPSCGQGRLKTTPKGKVCADCGVWQNGSGEAPRPGLGLCPKCKAGQLSVKKGQYGPFVSCSDRACGLIYNSDEAGVPEGGRCRQCQGPVKKTRAGSLLCAVCGTWQDAAAKAPGAATGRAPGVAAGRATGGAARVADRGAAAGDARPAKPKDATCPVCRQALRTVWTKKNKWAYRCDRCDRWLDPPR